MKLTSTRKTLKQALTGLRKIAPRNSGLPILSAIRFEVSDGSASTAATDLDAFAVCHIGSSEENADGVCICPLEALKALSKGKSADVVEIESHGTDIVVRAFVGGQAVERRVEGFDPADWPESPPRADLRDAEGILGKLRRAAPSVSRESTRRELCGICFDPAGKNQATVVATDGRRLTAVNSIDLALDEQHIVPATPFLTWNRLGDDARIGFKADGDARWFGMECGDWRYTARCSDGEYPAWTQVVPSADGRHQVVFAAADCEVLRQALPAFPGADRADKPVVIAGRSGRLIVLAGDRENGWTELELENSVFDGPDGRIAFNRGYLLDAIDAGFIFASFEDGMCPARFDDGNGAVHVLMPLRLADMPGEEEAESEQAVRETAPERKAEKPAAAEPNDNRKEKSKPEKRKEQEKMTQDRKKEPTAAEKALAICLDAKQRLSDTRTALMEATKATREAIREQKRQESEMRDVRKGLERIRQIEV